MKIFISWSGDTSRLIAEALRDWMPDVINFLEPWVSSADIGKGSRWPSDLNRQLEETDMGIVCLTRTNLEAPWILFEAGALGKSLAQSKVCTYLYDLKTSDLDGPLVQFQATVATKDDTLNLLRTINQELGSKARPNEALERSFEKWWPELEKKLTGIPNENNKDTETRRNDRDLLEELLELVRFQARSSASSPSPGIGNATASEIHNFIRNNSSTHHLPFENAVKEFSGDYYVNTLLQEKLSISHIADETFAIHFPEHWIGTGVFDGRVYLGVYRYLDPHPIDSKFAGTMGIHCAVRIEENSYRVLGFNANRSHGAFVLSWTKLSQK